MIPQIDHFASNLLAGGDRFSSDGDDPCIRFPLMLSSKTVESIHDDNDNCSVFQLISLGEEVRPAQVSRHDAADCGCPYKHVHHDDLQLNGFYRGRASHYESRHCSSKRDQTPPSLHCLALVTGRSPRISSPAAVLPA
ncbi:hypothetical protein AKJ16_DCAP00661 [Drosera capensis]